MNLDKINDRNWELLMSAVDEKRVVPIIGENLIQVVTEEGRMNIREYVLAKLAPKLGVSEFQNFSQVEDVIRDNNARTRNAGDVTDIYYEIYEVLKYAEISVPDFVVKMFSNCDFPLILTTSYANGLDKALQLPSSKICVYNKNMSSDVSKADILSNTSVLYYLFGKLGITKRSFKVTEDDLLDYLHCWHNNDTRPLNLSEFLSDKFLLVLGCNYPNWLFRFFWHSIRNFTIVPSTPEMQGVVTVAANKDEDLMTFLSRVQTSVYRNAEDFITEFITRYSSRHSTDRTSSGYAIPTIDQGAATNSFDIFISYAEEDFDKAHQVAEHFNRLGASVWFDKDRLTIGENYETTIKDMITNCKRFVPILSKTTLIQGRRFFKREWSWAKEESEYRLSEPYISPIVIDDINPFIESAIPSKFTKESHIIRFDDPEFENQVKKLIRSFR